MNMINHKGYELIILNKFPSYAISRCGKVFSLNYWNKGIIKQLVSCCSHGYEYVNLWKNKKHKKCAVHRLVAEAFLKSRKGKTEINHLDFNKKNNNVCNLEWCTHAENMKHASLGGKMASSDKQKAAAKITGSLMGAQNAKKGAYKQAKLSYHQATEIKGKLLKGAKQNALAVQYSVSNQTICNIAHGKKQCYQNKKCWPIDILAGGINGTGPAKEMEHITDNSLSE